MPADIFRIDWYPQKSFISFSRLNAEQIGVLMQIINLIYIRNGPIDNDERFIGKNCNIRKGKARRIINELLELEEIYLTESGKISHKRCDIALSDTRNRIEEYSKNGKKGAKTRWGTQENQEVENGKALSSDMASTNNDTNKNIKTPTKSSSGIYQHKRAYDIDHHLSDEARKIAKENSPGWDQQYLMREYNNFLYSKGESEPTFPNSAYPAWVKKITKGKPPP